MEEIRKLAVADDVGDASAAGKLNLWGQVLVGGWRYRIIRNAQVLGREFGQPGGKSAIRGPVFGAADGEAQVGKQGWAESVREIHHLILERTIVVDVAGLDARIIESGVVAKFCS